MSATSYLTCPSGHRQPDLHPSVIVCVDCEHAGARRTAIAECVALVQAHHDRATKPLQQIALFRCLQDMKGRLDQ